MILDRYFARLFLQSFLVIAGIFLSLILLIDLIEQVRRFEGLGLSFGQVFRLTLLNAPAAMSEILPLLMILATIILFVGLARSSELVATRAIGRSGIRALAAPVLVALTIGILAVAMLNPIVAATSERYQRLSDSYRNGGASALSLSGEGLWLRQGSPSGGQSVIHATGFGGEEGVTLYNVTILTFARDGGPVRQVFADSAQLAPRTWILSNAKVWPLVAGINPEANAALHETLEIPTTLTQDRIRDTLSNQDTISIYDLPEVIAALREAGFNTKQHEVWLQVQLARPLFLVSMVLVGAAFTMRHVRFGGTGVAVLTAVLLGFALYFIRNFAQILGENGQIPIILAAWAPPVAALMLTFGLLLHAEDG